VFMPQSQKAVYLYVYSCLYESYISKWFVYGPMAKC